MIINKDERDKLSHVLLQIEKEINRTPDTAASLFIQNRLNEMFKLLKSAIITQ